MGADEDPYHEEIPENELHFYQKKGAKRKKRLPNFIEGNDLKVLESVKKQAYRLDLQLSICGLRLGWSGIIGLIPWVGDLIACALALQLIKKAEKIDGGLPSHLRLKMMANVTMDFGIGLIPFVGDFINILYKCNSRNFIILEKHLVKKYSQKHGLSYKEHEVDQLANQEMEATYNKDKRNVNTNQTNDGNKNSAIDNRNLNLV